jgi:predicted DNA-binding protein
MSQPDNGNTTGNGRSGVKTLAIRLEPDLHAQLSLIAQLRSSTITDEIRHAIETHIENVKTAPELAAQAGSVLEAIEAEAAARRDAISTLFGTAQPTAPATSRERGTKRTNGTENAAQR